MPKSAGQLIDACEGFIGSAHSARATLCTWVWFETVTSAGNANVIWFWGRPSFRATVNLLKLGIERQSSGRGADEVLVLANGLIEHDANRNAVSRRGKILRDTPNTPSILPLRELSWQTRGCWTQMSFSLP